MVKPGRNDRWLAAGDRSHGGGARKSPTGLRFVRGLLLQLAGARAHLVVAAVGCRVAGIEAGDELWWRPEFGRVWAGVLRCKASETEVQVGFLKTLGA